MIAAIIPAHDEASGVEHAVVELHRQTRPPERILVMSDDSTDSTVDVALAAGAEVLMTVDNAQHKAGGKLRRSGKGKRAQPRQTLAFAELPVDEVRE